MILEERQSGPRHSTRPPEHSRQKFGFRKFGANFTTTSNTPLVEGARITSKFAPLLSCVVNREQPMAACLPCDRVYRLSSGEIPPGTRRHPLKSKLKSFPLCDECSSSRGNGAHGISVISGARISLRWSYASCCDNSSSEIRQVLNSK